jgi:hypothetical protein
LDLDRAVSNALLLHIVDRRCANEAPARSKKLRSGHVQSGPLPPAANKKQRLHTSFQQPPRRPRISQKALSFPHLTLACLTTARVVVATVPPLRRAVLHASPAILGTHRAYYFSGVDRG